MVGLHCLVSQDWLKSVAVLLNMLNRLRRCLLLLAAGLEPLINAEFYGHSSSGGGTLYDIISSFQHAGFGEPIPALYLRPFSNYPIGELALMANLPQLLVSFFCLLYNNVFTGMVLSQEFARFGTFRTGLRESKPQGQQGWTFWLQLPYRYILPMMLAMTLLHLAISRSLFLEQITAYNYPGRLPGTTYTSALYWSPEPIIVSICIGGILMLALF